MTVIAGVPRLLPVAPLALVFSLMARSAELEP
jgi:hypothetical protein